MQSSFRLRASHPLWSDFPFASSNRRFSHDGLLQPHWKTSGLGFLRFRSPLLTESHSLFIPPLTEMFHFSGSCALWTMDSSRGNGGLTPLGYPIRKSPGQSVFAALRSLSQLITSFFACWHQGIHHALLVALFLRYFGNLLFVQPPCPPLAER